MSDDIEALYNKSIEVRWSDCDANQHMRHSAYADICAHARLGFFDQVGMTSDWFKEQGVSPVLFKEETEYFREAFMGEILRITVAVGEPTGSKKSIRLLQEVYKPSGELGARHQVVLGWIDVKRRKVVELPEKIRSLSPRESSL